jgi:hypothetical protein
MSSETGSLIVDEMVRPHSVVASSSRADLAMVRSVPRELDLCPLPVHVLLHRYFNRKLVRLANTILGHSRLLLRLPIL